MFRVTYQGEICEFWCRLRVEAVDTADVFIHGPERFIKDVNEMLDRLLDLVPIFGQ